MRVHTLFDEGEPKGKGRKRVREESERARGIEEVSWGRRAVEIREGSSGVLKRGSEMMPRVKRQRERVETDEPQ
jgi:hypothetical protein